MDDQEYYNNIIALAKKNTSRRHTLFTDGDNGEVNVMNIKKGDNEGMRSVQCAQYIFGVSGLGLVDVGSVTYPIKEGMMVIVPKSTQYRIVNITDEPLKLYSVCSQSSGNSLPSGRQIQYPGGEELITDMQNAITLQGKSVKEHIRMCMTSKEHMKKCMSAGYWKSVMATIPFEEAILILVFAKNYIKERPDLFADVLSFLFKHYEKEVDLLRTRKYGNDKVYNNLSNIIYEMSGNIEPLFRSVKYKSFKYSFYNINPNEVTKEHPNYKMFIDTYYTLLMLVEDFKDGSQRGQWVDFIKIIMSMIAKDAYEEYYTNVGHNTVIRLIGITPPRSLSPKSKGSAKKENTYDLFINLYIYGYLSGIFKKDPNATKIGRLYAGDHNYIGDDYIGDYIKLISEDKKERFFEVFDEFAYEYL